MFEWLLDNIVPWIVLGTLGATLALACVALYIFAADYNKPTFSLRKDEWTCTSSEKRTTMVMSGKILIPVTNTVCLQWTKI